MSEFLAMETACLAAGYIVPPAVEWLQVLAMVGALVLMAGSVWLVATGGTMWRRRTPLGMSADEYLRGLNALPRTHDEGDFASHGLQGGDVWGDKD